MLFCASLVDVLFGERWAFRHHPPTVQGGELKGLFAKSN